MKSTVALLALAAGANAANYVWNGRPTNFNLPGNWKTQPGAPAVNPAAFIPSQQPGGIIIGDLAQPSPAGFNIVTSVDVGTYTVGRSITFNEAGTLVLGDGQAGSVTTLNFNANAQTPVATFTIDNEFGCPSNWVAPEATCGNDDANCEDPCLIPTATDTIAFPPPSFPPANYVIAFGPGNKILGRQMSAVGTCDSTTNIWSTYPGSPFSATITFPQGASCYSYGRQGAGQCPRDDDGQFDPTAFEGLGFRGTCRDADDEAARLDAITTQSPTAAPTNAAIDSSSSSAEDDSSGTIMIVVVIALILILGVVAAVVVIVKKNAAGGADERGQVSFENPMYDQAGQPQEQAQVNPMYAEPGDGASGYMDVPAGGGGDGGGGGGGSGYMDVSPTAAATGYMDIAPGGFPDDDDDAEDV